MCGGFAAWGHKLRVKILSDWKVTCTLSFSHRAFLFPSFEVCTWTSSVFQGECPMSLKLEIKYLHGLSQSFSGG